MIVRFAPTEAGSWSYRITSNLRNLDGKEGSFQAAASESPGYVHVANVHHWATDNKKAHLWMGYVIDHFGFLSQEELDRTLSAVAANKFNHVRASLLGSPAEQSRAWTGQDQPNYAYFEEFDRRILSFHKKGITTDLILAANPDALAKLFPDWQSRKRFIRYVVGRYTAFNITWQGLEEFEGYINSRQLLKEIGLDLKELDGYGHPRSTNAKLTSSPLFADGWMDFIIDHSSDDQIGAVEHQFYPVPFVGVTPVERLWNATMDGQYPEIEGPVGKQPSFWFDLLSDTRHWELEPYFDVDAARCVALEDVDYVVLVEKSGPIEVSVEKHGYDVSWLNPLNGEAIEQKKYHGEHFTGQAPDNTHPWILRIAREGHVEAMNKSYRFDSRPVPVQEIESSPQKVPFQIVDPAGDSLAGTDTFPFSVKVLRATRATRSMMYLWTGDVPADGQGFRVLATGAQGSLHIPPDIATRYPAILNIRVSCLNANGKAYTADKVYTLSK